MRIFTIANIFIFCLASHAQENEQNGSLVALVSTVNTPSISQPKSSNSSGEIDSSVEANSIIQELFFQGMSTPNRITPDMVESLEKKLDEIDPEVFASAVVGSGAHSADLPAPEVPVSLELEVTIIEEGEPAAPEQESRPKKTSRPKTTSRPAPSPAPRIKEEPEPKKLGDIIKEARAERKEKRDELLDEISHNIKNRPKPLKEISERIQAVRARNKAKRESR